MCGIYGAVGASVTDVVQRMGETLVHRGPDADGVAARNGAMLGCRRLAIVDVVSGAQPVSNESGDVIAVCNGEIYNAAEIRGRFPDYPYRSHSDVETILPLYLERGVSAIPELDGMFGLAIWDARTRTWRTRSKRSSR